MIAYKCDCGAWRRGSGWTGRARDRMGGARPCPREPSAQARRPLGAGLTCDAIYSYLAASYAEARGQARCFVQKSRMSPFPGLE
jgi:hypothetical protein